MIAGGVPIRNDARDPALCELGAVNKCLQIYGAFEISQPISIVCQSAVGHPPVCEPKLGPSFVTETARVVDQSRLARETYRLRLHAPEIARRIVPGQFFMVRLPDRSDPLLARPFALYDVSVDSLGEPTGMEFVYHVVGKATRMLSRLAPGDTLELWGPLGNGFPPPTGGRLFCLGRKQSEGTRNLLSWSRLWISQ